MRSSAPEVQYRPAIDGLRTIAVLAVFVFHLKHQWLPGGFVGVDIFFVISGYLITSVLLREYQRRSFSLRKFYQRRIARLFPAFFTVALATLTAAFFIYSPFDLAFLGTSLAAASLSLANMRYLLQGNYFTISPDAQPLLHCWSLSVEEQFYLLFPVALLLVYLKANRFKTEILAVFCGLSLLACIALTRIRPDWAFYLLPTRAWELLAGSILANLHEQWTAREPTNRSVWLPLTGLVLIAISLLVIHEGPAFPGYLAVLPVLGTVCFLAPNHNTGFVEKLLSGKAMVLIGRMSYSLYLWHWPVFCLVDYKFYLSSSLFRVGLKVALTAVLTALCFFFIENPGRTFFNRPARRRLAFSFLAAALLCFVPLGLVVKRTNYIAAAMNNVAAGGIVFNPSGKNGSLDLMGDSHGSMYGTMAREVARTLDLRLAVISVTAGDPLPNDSDQSSHLWLDSLALLTRDHPDFLVLACRWQAKIARDRTKLETAVNALKQHCRYLILITQPPELPLSASRESMRNGSRPPFFEDPIERAARMYSNALVKSFQGGNVIVVDIEPLFTASQGSLLFADPHGIRLYQDAGHLSGAGADRVKPELVKVLTTLPRK